MSAATATAATVASAVASSQAMKKRKLDTTATDTAADTTAADNGPFCEHLTDFDFETMTAFGPLRAGDRVKTVPINPKKNPYDRVRVQLNGGGRIPKSYGVEVADEKIRVKLNISSEQESEALKNISANLVDLVKANKDAFWPHGNTEEDVVDNYQALYTPGNPKDDGSGFWDDSVRMTVPSENGQPNSLVTILDHDGQEVKDINALAGRKWDVAIMEFSGLYLSGKKKFGLVKKLASIQLAKPNFSYSKVPFLAKKQV